MSDQSHGVDEQQAIGQKAKPATKAEQEESRALSDLSRGQDKSRLSMKVKVYSPFRDYYDGPAFSITAESATGPFDILPKHHNFISLLLPCDLIIRTVGKGNQKIRISGGLMHVKADEVIVFLDV